MQPTTPFELDPDEFPLQNENDAMLQAALETTRDAIARWTGGIHRPRMMQIGTLHTSPQARWYARACEGFEKWREGGGFAQDERSTQHQQLSDRALLNIDSEDAFNY